MVPLMIQDMLSSRRAALASVIRSSFGHTRHVDALVVRLAAAFPNAQVLDSAVTDDFDFSATREELVYQGFPRLAASGFGFEVEKALATRADDFVDEVLRLRNSGKARVQTFGTDDVATLGVCAGLAFLGAHHSEALNLQRFQEARSWALLMAETHSNRPQWTVRLRLLAADLLDKRGRLNAAPAADDIDAQVADIALSHIWPLMFSRKRQLDDSECEQILSHLLTSQMPQAGDLERAAFWLCVLPELIAGEARSLLRPSEDTAVALSTPYVFISYTHDSPEHKKVVLGLSDRLRSDGIDCQIDQYVDAPAQGWPRWMEEQLERANYVLVVCTEAYMRRTRGIEEQGKGLGATWESGVITQELYEAQGANVKFIPVVFAKEQCAFIPRMLKGTSYYDLGTPDGYDLLYRRLTQQPTIKKPPLGSMRHLP